MISMIINQTDIQGTIATVIKFTDKLTGKNAPAVREALVQAIQSDSTSQKILLDMASVHCVDSRGITVLIIALGLCRNLGLKLLLTNVQNQVACVLSGAGLDGCFPELTSSTMVNFTSSL